MVACADEGGRLGAPAAGLGAGAGGFGMGGGGILLIELIACPFCNRWSLDLLDWVASATFDAKTRASTRVPWNRFAPQASEAGRTGLNRGNPKATLNKYANFRSGTRKSLIRKEALAGLGTYSVLP